MEPKELIVLLLIAVPSGVALFFIFSKIDYTNLESVYLVGLIILIGAAILSVIGANLKKIVNLFEKR